MSTEDEAYEQVRLYAQSHVALDARILALDYDPDHGWWVADVISSSRGRSRLLARWREGAWEVWKYLGGIRPKQ